MYLLVALVSYLSIHWHTGVNVRWNKHVLVDLIRQQVCYCDIAQLTQMLDGIVTFGSFGIPGIEFLNSNVSQSVQLLFTLENSMLE
jgi:hypothetical protein